MKYKIVSKLPNAKLHYIQPMEFDSEQKAQDYIDEYKCSGYMMEGEIAFVAEKK
jgi:hypothetical protein